MALQVWPIATANNIYMTAIRAIIKQISTCVECSCGKPTNGSKNTSKNGFSINIALFSHLLIFFFLRSACCILKCANKVKKYIICIHLCIWIRSNQSVRACIWYVYLYPWLTSLDSFFFLYFLIKNKIK